MSDASTQATITPAPNGPLIAKGVTIVDAEGRPLPDQRPTVALCRCGRSATKPYCDSTHKLVGFEAP